MRRRRRLSPPPTCPTRSTSTPSPCRSAPLLEMRREEDHDGTSQNAGAGVIPLLVVALVAAALVGAVAVASAAMRRAPSGWPASARRGGCRSSRWSARGATPRRDDPIVEPGATRPTRTCTTSSATPPRRPAPPRPPWWAATRRARTSSTPRRTGPLPSCATGSRCNPIGAVAYYRPGPEVDPASVQPYPTGLMMVAGDPGAVEPQPLAVAVVALRRLADPPQPSRRAARARRRSVCGSRSPTAGTASTSTATTIAPTWPAASTVAALTITPCRCRS